MCEKEAFLHQNDLDSNTIPPDYTFVCHSVVVTVFKLNYFPLKSGSDFDPQNTYIP